MNETLIGLICILGSLAVLLAALGVVRLPDFFSRTHAATKASAFGLGCFLLAACIAFPQANVILKSIFALIALFLTLPVATQALADAVHTGKDNDYGDDD
ncbi:MAG TPA: monovalent cation/H(+) antiporter subunit G [Luteolibacter sp.]|nr:monovalent cation/H(+) antiporter subunit G [Luteolibacter sp.]